MKRINKFAAALVIVPVVAISGTVFADSPGQLTTGSNVFQVKNLTQNGSYASSANTVCGDEVQYSTRLHNAAFGGLTNVVVTVNLPSGSVAAVPAEGATTGTSGNVSVSLPSGGSLAYENGTAVLYDQNGTIIENLPDTITTSGVNVGTIQGSTTEFVDFKAKVNCPTPPVTPPVTTTPTPAPVTPAKPATPAPAQLVNTGPGSVVGLFAVVTVVGTVAHRLYSRRFARAAK